MSSAEAAGEGFRAARAALRAAALPGSPDDVSAAVLGTLRGLSDDSLREVQGLCRAVQDAAQSLITSDTENDQLDIPAALLDEMSERFASAHVQQLETERLGRWPVQDTEPVEKVPGRSSAWFDAGQTRAGVNVPALEPVPELHHVCPGCGEPINRGDSVVFEVATSDGMRHVRCAVKGG